MDLQLVLFVDISCIHKYTKPIQIYNIHHSMCSNGELLLYNCIY